MVAGRVGITGVAADGVLSGQHEPVPAALQQLADDLLAGPAAVIDRGVDDVAARLGVRAQDAGALLGRGADPALLAERHRAQEQLGDPEPGAAEQRVPHQLSPWPKASAASRATSPGGTSRMC